MIRRSATLSEAQLTAAAAGPILPINRAGQAQQEDNQYEHGLIVSNTGRAAIQNALSSVFEYSGSESEEEGEEEENLPPRSPPRQQNGGSATINASLSSPPQGQQVGNQAAPNSAQSNASSVDSLGFSRRTGAFDGLTIEDSPSPNSQKKGSSSSSRERPSCSLGSAFDEGEGPERANSSSGSNYNGIALKAPASQPSTSSSSSSKGKRSLDWDNKEAEPINNQSHSATSTSSNESYEFPRVEEGLPSSLLPVQHRKKDTKTHGKDRLFKGLDPNAQAKARAKSNSTRQQNARANQVNAFRQKSQFSSAVQEQDDTINTLGKRHLCPGTFYSRDFNDLSSDEDL